MRAVRRLLIVKLSAIGDVVHALPVSAALAEAFPHVEISWVVEPMSAPMLQGNPFLREVIVLPAAWRISRLSLRSFGLFRQIRRDLRARRFDIALDLQGLSKSALVTWATGAKLRYGQDWLRELAPLVETRIARRPESVHVVDQLLDTARFLGASVPRVEFPLLIREEEQNSADTLLRECGIDPMSSFIVYNPSMGGGGFKGWAPDRMAALIDRIASQERIPGVLVGSRADVELSRAICAAARNPPASLVARTDLRQLAAILRRAALHVCGDTGSAHIAAALGTPVVSIFGRTDPDRLAPYGFRHLVAHRRECCRPACRRFHETAPLNRKQKCLSPPPACMEAVSVDDVMEKVMIGLQACSR